LFAPRSVAVVGVSRNQNALGSIVLRNVRDGGFSGPIYAVGAQVEAIEGVEVVRSLGELRAPVELVFLSIPADAAVAALPECAAAGAKAVIVGAAGFAEDGDAEGVARQARLVEAARNCGVRLVGPNCNGITSAAASLSLGFNTGHGKRWPEGGVAIISHSGALFDSMAQSLAKAGGGLASFVSTGNEADLDTLDYLELLLDQRSARVIALFVDAIADGERLRRLALRADAQGISIVALKIGSSAIGAEAAMAHSSRLVGSARAYAALFRACGIATAETIEGLMAAAALLERAGRRQGGLAAISSSGAGCSLLADRAERYGVGLPRIPPDIQPIVDRHRRFSTIANPADLGTFLNPPAAMEAFAAMAGDPAVGMLMGVMHSFLPPHLDTLADGLAAAAGGSGKPMLIVAPGGLDEEERQRYRSGGSVVLDDMDVAMQAIAAVLTPGPWPMTEPGEPPADLPGGPLSEHDSLALLASQGIATVPSTLCASADEAVAAGARIAGPIVLKASIPGLVHKSDAGLVFLDLADKEAIRAACAKCGERAGFVVQPKLKGSLEAIIGLDRSQDTGLTLIAGLGGIYAEAMRDVAMWSVPAPREAIRDGIVGSALGRILASPRWAWPGRLEQLVDAIDRLQHFGLAMGDALEAVDINPLLIGECGVVAVDASIIAARHKAQAGGEA
jgi:acyl-CoA synthetase (NDP forming)